ncbi:ubiquitin carboxyl-terminal hydrolase 16-like, partial [Stegodyphus dumicola]|uniref:ubiquitin carboxyl-terminal hydrolase 16-like n=1 Tax=Stegodyphus dumicola TaxID=202533 RepID=UPI0015AEE959
MAKKKNSRQKHQKDVSFADTSEEELNDGIKQGKCCPHISRGINFGRIKKSLKASENINVCSGCDAANKDDPPEVWLCLQCGYRGCGRMSSNKHGLQHFRTIHSDCHSLVLSSSSGVVWCYDCDDEVLLQVSRNLRQCVEFIMKLKGNKPNLKSTDEKTGTHENLQESAIKEMHPKISEEPVRDSKSSKTPKSNAKSNISVSKSSIKGLRNLGNTCFFNAVMQNLAQTYLLYQELEDSCNPDFVWEVPRLTITNETIIENSKDVLKLILPRQFPLANSLLNLFKKMCAPSTSKVEVINPSALFGEISKKSPQFQHFQQQDSHELLRQLLDGIRQEEIK